jgi:propanol-preferring alcohol dehydrogenase
MLDVFGGDNVGEQFAHAGGFQDDFRFDAQGSGRDDQREPLGAPAHESGRAGVRHVAIGDHPLIDSCLPLDHRGERGFAGIFPAFLQDRGKAVAIVEPDKVAEVVAAVEFDTFGAEHEGEGFEMKRLGIGERAVEIEYNRAYHLGSGLRREHRGLNYRSHAPRPPIRLITDALLRISSFFAGEPMKAMAVHTPAPIETAPLSAIELPEPEPGDREILVRVRTCGVCRTDLHVAEGDLPPRLPRIIPGHEIVGEIARCAPGCERFSPGQRVGVAWLRETCGHCVYCRRERENLCPNARFTGYDHDGGYAEFVTAREDFAYPIPAGLGDEEAAPLLCAGIIGFRAIKRAEVRFGSTVGLYGFGGSAHIALQVLKHWRCRVFVMTRGGVHRELAESMGADWVGSTAAEPPHKLDAAILFAPAGDLVPTALEALDRGGILAVAGIYLTRIPELDYERHLFYERELRSVTANTRADAEEFLKIAGEIPVRTHTLPMPLEEANRALWMLKHDQLKGAAVLRVSRS